MTHEKKKTKMSGTAIGKANEKRSIKYLEENGWLVYTVASLPARQITTADGRMVWMKSSSEDIFGLWDHIAVRKPSGIMQIDIGGVPTGELDKMIWEDIPWDDSWGINKLTFFPNVIFIQTKSQRQYGKLVEMYHDFPYKYCYIFAWEKNKSNRYELHIQRTKKSV